MARNHRRWIKLVVFLVFSLMLNGTAVYATDTVSVAVRALAGVQPVLTLTCSDVDFSVWRVPVRSGGEPTRITLGVEENRANAWTDWRISGDAAWVSWASGHAVTRAGTCILGGSNHPGQQVQVSISNHENLNLAGATRSLLNKPSADAALRADLALVENFVQIDSHGEGSFRIVGELTIPADIIYANYGGYSALVHASGNLATVTVTDTVMP